MDPKHVFKEVSAAGPSGEDKGAANNAHANVFMPEKKRRHRDGYADGDYTLFKKTTAEEFIKCLDPVVFLGSVNRIMFESDKEKEYVPRNITVCEADGLVKMARFGYYNI